MFICSASSTKRVGAIGPCVALVHRASASTDVTRAGPQVDDRLEHGVDRPAADPSSELGLELGAGDDRLLHRWLEDHDLVAPFALAAIHRDVGLSEQLLGVDVLAVDHRHADRRADVEPAPAEAQRRPDRPGDVVGGCRGAGQVALLEHHDELVAAEARCRAGTLDRPLDPTRDLLQHAVACRVPTPVVDRLEAIEVDEQHGERVTVASGLFDALGEPIEEQAPVRQPGEMVRQGQAHALARIGVEQRDSSVLGEDLQHLALGFGERLRPQGSDRQAPDRHTVGADRNGHRGLQALVEHHLGRIRRVGVVLDDDAAVLPVRLPADAEVGARGELGELAVTYPVRRDEDEAARVGRIAQAQAHDGLAEELSGAVDDRDEHVVERGASGDRALDPHQAGQEPLTLLELGAQRPVVLVELQLDLQVRPEAFFLGEVAEADDHTVDPGDVVPVGQEGLDRTPAIAFAHPESQRPTAVVVGNDLGEAFDDVLNVVGMHHVERLRPGMVGRRDERSRRGSRGGTVGVREPEVVVDDDDHVVDAVEQRARVEVRRRRSRWEASPLSIGHQPRRAVDVAMNTQRGRPGGCRDQAAWTRSRIRSIRPRPEVDDDEAHRLGEGHGRSTAPARPQHETPCSRRRGRDRSSRVPSASPTPRPLASATTTMKTSPSSSTRARPTTRPSWRAAIRKPDSREHTRAIRDGNGFGPVPSSRPKYLGSALISSANRSTPPSRLG